MGDVLTIPKKIRNYPPINVKDTGGQTVNFGIYSNGENAVYNAASDKFLNQRIQPQGFYVIPLVAGVIEVQLFNQEDGETYVISALEVGTPDGKPLPYRLKKILSTASATTVNSMKIVW